MENIMNLLFPAGIIMVSILTVGLIFTRLYKRATKKMAFVRTGLGGEKVIKDGGAIVLPILHDIINVNMNTLRLEVKRGNEHALITRDRMLVDVTAEFYVRVAPNQEAIAMAAQSLGVRTLDVDSLRMLIEGKFVDVLRTVAAEMAMEELHEQRADFVQRVQHNVKHDLEKNGLELETVSLTGLDQTDPKFFRENNAFDAEGLTILTKITESRKKIRNDVVRETEVKIQNKNLEAEREKLKIHQQSEYARLEQQKQVQIRKVEQEAEIAVKIAEQEAEAEVKKAESLRTAELADIQAKQVVESEQVAKDRAIAVAEQEKAIKLAQKSLEESAAQAEAAELRARAVEAEEAVKTVRETACAQRNKEIELIEARLRAEQEAIQKTLAAEAEKKAALDIAESIRIEAQAMADRQRIEAEAASQSEKILAEGKAQMFEVEAAGRRAINEAENLLSAQQIEMQLKKALYERLPDIIRETVRPMEKIEGIKIVQFDGVNPGVVQSGPGENGAKPSSPTSLADSVTDAALRYQVQKPLVKELLSQIGLSSDSVVLPAGLLSPEFAESTE